MSMPKTTKKNTTSINIVLDRSGSMNAVLSDTIGGFNTFVAEQAKASADATLTLVQFDDQYEVVYADVPVGEVKKLTNKTFVPRGNTALFDAIGRTITELGTRLDAMPEKQRPGKVILVVITDGQENASREYDSARVFSMIAHQRTKYAWEFVFIGTTAEAIEDAKKLGIMHTMSHAGSHRSTRAMYQTMSSAMRGYTAQGHSVVQSFFKDDDKNTSGTPPVKV